VLKVKRPSYALLFDEVSSGLQRAYEFMLLRNPTPLACLRVRTLVPVVDPKEFWMRHGIIRLPAATHGKIWPRISPFGKADEGMLK